MSSNDLLSGRDYPLAMLVIEAPLGSPTGEALTTGLLAIATTKILSAFDMLLMDMVRTFFYACIQHTHAA